MTDREVIDKIKWFMHERAHDPKICDYLINILEKREKQNKGCDMCRGLTSWTQFLDGNHPEVEFKYCPICGREIRSVMANNLMVYTMYVFKPSGKYYTHEDIVVDMSKYKCYEVADAIRSGEIYTGYKDMHKVFISQYDGNDRDKMLYTVPFMIRSDER